MSIAGAPDAAAYAAVARFGRPALAWEVLRRDTAYQAAFRAWAQSGTPNCKADAEFAARWGLPFP